MGRKRKREIVVEEEEIDEEGIIQYYGRDIISFN